MNPRTENALTTGPVVEKPKRKRTRMKTKNLLAKRESGRFAKIFGRSIRI